ncbi:hypothetical protein ALIPUT_02001 [Alistipes putredinis DSM 17216]|uniref:Uncharacterized protein n=1 Tax=Alistipes putredinis DSM 17216 TaxID=445970 RepID=B0MXY8_9BACT|nr:hypothetical protein ALIPUT_02001 [Alistipes putredinis DSM 17216]
MPQSLLSLTYVSYEKYVFTKIQKYRIATVSEITISPLVYPICRICQRLLFIFYTF